MISNTKKMTTDPILLEKWYLADNGTITCWIQQHHYSYNILKPCYSGKTNGFQIYGTSADGHSVVDGLGIEYEFIIPLTQLKQRKVKWQWQGLYNNTLMIHFNIEQHIQESKHEQRQTLKEINDIISKLNEPPKAKYILHNFRLSEGIVLCQHCGEFLTELKKEKTNLLPPCRANL
jgi:hypothetical protein